eukprot:1149294-Pelagomonas_calceolata.AAC.5
MKEKVTEWFRVGFQLALKLALLMFAKGFNPSRMAGASILLASSMPEICILNPTQGPASLELNMCFQSPFLCAHNRNKHIMIDLGTGNNNKISWAMSDKQEFIDIVEVIYRGARKGRGLVVSPKDYSTKQKAVTVQTRGMSAQGAETDWSFLQCFGERTPGEDIQEGGPSHTLLELHSCLSTSSQWEGGHDGKASRRAPEHHHPLGLGTPWRVLS